MKKLFLLMVSIFSLLLTSCGEDTTQIAKDEFSKFYSGNDEVVLLHNDIIYTEKQVLDLNTLVKDEESNDGIIFKEDMILFSTSVQNSMFDYSFNIYESNLQGTEIQLIFSKDGFKTHPWAYAIDGNFYIEHYSENALSQDGKIIDRYSVNENKYESVARGKDCSLSDYVQEETSQYSIEMVENVSSQEHGKFVVTDSNTGTERIIDDEYLESTIYFESMKKFNYGPKRFEVSNGYILLTYSIGAGDGWTYAHLVFEYDFDSNTLEYKLLAFPHDNVSIDIIYIPTMKNFRGSDY
ncbi:MAG: hypothetical protein ACI4TK_06160 [Agathobacter sp.]